RNKPSLSIQNIHVPRFSMDILKALPIRIPRWNYPQKLPNPWNCLPVPAPQAEVNLIFYTDDIDIHI
ncbi:MAG: hypothetical protein AAGU32_12645, partial [Bacillota bacterium]